MSYNAISSHTAAKSDVIFVSKSERGVKRDVGINRKNYQLKRHSTESAVSSESFASTQGVSAGSITPCVTVQHAVETLKAAHYQTPQTLRSKFENSTPASPKSIQYLTERLNLYSQTTDEAPFNDNFNDILVVPIAGLMPDPIHCIEKDSGDSGGAKSTPAPTGTVTFQIHDSERHSFDLPLSVAPGSSASFGRSASSPDALESLNFVRQGNQHVESALSISRSFQSKQQLKRSQSVQSFGTSSMDTYPPYVPTSPLNISNHSTSNLMGARALGDSFGRLSGDSLSFLEEYNFQSSEKDRKDRKRRMSILKYGRRAARNGERRTEDIHTNGFSPSAKSKYRPKSRASRQNLSREEGTPFALFGHDHDSSLDRSHQNHSRLINLNSSNCDAHSGIIDDSNCRFADESHIDSLSLDLNEQTFRGIVIGGVYQHCFDDTCPVVASPSCSEKRVVGLYFTATKALVLRLFIPKDRKTTSINLSSDWKCIRASPVGFLVAKTSFLKLSRFVCYFLPKHPLNWNIENDLQIISTNVVIDSQPFFDESDRIEMDGSFVNEDMNDDEYGNHMDIEVPLQERVEVISAITAPQTACPEWYNSSIVRLILEFLIDLDVPQNVDQESKQQNTGISRRNVRRHNTMPQAAERNIRNGTRSTSFHNFQDQASSNEEPLRPLRKNSSIYYQFVCKAWALSVQMILARRLSNIIDHPTSIYDYERWCQFMRDHSAGEFLGDGACKKVFAVKRKSSTDSSKVIAISVMNVQQLIEDGMDCAIRQELEISLLCSSSVTLNICPNLVLIHSLFQSEFPVPESIWWQSGRVLNSGGKRTGRGSAASVGQSDTVPLPTRAEMEPSKGRYQFFCMEFCSGGDIEGLIRKKKLLHEDVVLSFLFQMCFSMYTCREKLAMRHFDIKLLNFLVTDSSAISSSPSSGRRDEHMRVGFGRHVFRLAMPTSESSLVKLADYGTSIIGEKGLGDNINKMQVLKLYRLIDNCFDMLVLIAVYHFGEHPS